MKKIYLVVSSAVNDCEDYGIGTIAFDSRAKAEKFFRSQVEQEKEAIKDFDWVIEESEDSFCAYEDGNYSANHTIQEIREMVVE